MTVILVACGLIALALPGFRLALARRVQPRWFVSLDGLALLLGMLSVLFGLTLSVAVGVVHLAVGTSLLRFGGHLAPGGIITSACSGALLAVLITRITRAALRARSAARLARPECWLGYHEHRDDHELVVLPTTVAVAYSIHGSPPQVVISEGLRARLDDDLVGFVLEHERCHLRRGHRRHALLAVVTDAAFRESATITRSTLALRMAVERSADEEAAGHERPVRRRAGRAFEQLAAHGHVGCAAEGPYRAQQLADAPILRPAAFEVLAAVGLVVLSVVTVAAAGHASSDVPGLLALLQG